MPRRIEHGGEDVPHGPRGVDNERDPPGHETEQRRGTVRAADRAALVTKQDKRQRVLLSKRLVRRPAVRTDADHFSPRRPKHLVAVTKGARLSGASLGVVFGIEVQDDRAATEQVAQPDGAPRGVEQREVGGAAADRHTPGSRFSWGAR